jgi:hypothetical protein
MFQMIIQLFKFENFEFLKTFETIKRENFEFEVN